MLVVAMKKMSSNLNLRLIDGSLARSLFCGARLGSGDNFTHPSSSSIHLFHNDSQLLLVDKCLL